MSAAAFDILTDFGTLEAAARDLRRGVLLPDDNALFITSKQPRNRLGNRSVQTELKHISKRAGIDYSVFPHLLRHSFATVGLNSGMSINVIHDLLGHERLDTTMIYAKTDTETARYEYRKHLNQ